MISTRKITIDSIKDIPSTWIFEHYLSLQEKLYGQEVTIRSIFNSLEKTPSMTVYPDKRTGKYKYKDFSSGSYGDGYDIVKHIFGMGPKEAVFKVMKDYSDFVNDNNAVQEEIKSVSKYKVCDYQARSWNTEDARYWTRFGIGSKTLERFNVMPLSSYVLEKEDQRLCITSAYIYGYFKEDGLIYKIYQPKSESRKFMKVRSHIQGMDQLTYGKPNLVILSSLKDLMSFEQLNFKTIETIAPDSENTMIPDKTMWDLISKYDSIVTLFDNDDAGKTGITRYLKKYGIQGFSLDLEKDVSDSIAKYGKEHVKKELVPLLTECINTCRRCPENSTLV